MRCPHQLIIVYKAWALHVRMRHEYQVTGSRLRGLKFCLYTVHSILRTFALDARGGGEVGSLPTPSDSRVESKQVYGAVSLGLPYFSWASLPTLSALCSGYMSAGIGWQDARQLAWPPVCCELSALRMLRPSGWVTCNAWLETGAQCSEAVEFRGRRCPNTKVSSELSGETFHKSHFLQNHTSRLLPSDRSHEAPRRSVSQWLLKHYRSTRLLLSCRVFSYTHTASSNVGTLRSRHCALQCSRQHDTYAATHPICPQPAGLVISNTWEVGFSRCPHNLRS